MKKLVLLLYSKYGPYILVLLFNDDKADHVS